MIDCRVSDLGDINNLIGVLTITIKDQVRCDTFEVDETTAKYHRILRLNFSVVVAGEDFPLQQTPRPFPFRVVSSGPMDHVV